MAINFPQTILTRSAYGSLRKTAVSELKMERDVDRIKLNSKDWYFRMLPFSRKLREKGKEKN
jgi:hypothetical protein